ncbi:hypothetical protein BVRB_2g034890 [Beta vulgaris subsp. vulgaris]|nr:hypothetical protein BVRB_2g034890 [Beta vulgaris subsp. vulgaris]
MEPKTPPVSTTDESAASSSSSSSKKRGREGIELDYTLDDAAAARIASFAFVTRYLESQAPIILYYNEQCHLEKPKALYLIQKLREAGVVEVTINPTEEAREGSFVIKLELDSGNPESIDFQVSRVT